MATRLTSFSKTRVSILQFPGSNCDDDCRKALSKYFQIETSYVWHTETNLPPSDAVVIPGGFSYGDYLRSGALASHSPILQALKSYVSRGGAVMGICNGFQILTESRLLPGVLLKNDHGKFVCQQQTLKAVAGSFWKPEALQSSVRFEIPIAHGDGRYFLPQAERTQLWENGQVAFVYEGANPNGSDDAIAGITDQSGKVLGMMPHPERAMNAQLTGSSSDGLGIWTYFLERNL